MGIVFSDDKPVECNCGCMVYSGWVTEATITVMHKGKPKTVIYTYCEEEGHEATAMHDALYKQLDTEQHHIMTAEDKENEYADLQRDEE